jgi:hypothetical protein
MHPTSTTNGIDKKKRTSTSGSRSKSKKTTKPLLNSNINNLNQLTTATV